MQLETTDGRTVTIIRSKDAGTFTSTIVCVTGVVQPDYTVSESTAEEFRSDFGILAIMIDV